LCPPCRTDNKIPFAGYYPSPKFTPEHNVPEVARFEVITKVELKFQIFGM
jgi:hypothetical protein